MYRRQVLVLIVGLLAFANLMALSDYKDAYVQVGLGRMFAILMPKQCGCSMSEAEHQENLKTLRCLRDQYVSATSTNRQETVIRPQAVNCWGDPIDYDPQKWCDWTYGGDCDGLLGGNPAYLKQRNRCKYTNSRYCCGPWQDIGCCSEDDATAEPPCVQPGPGWQKCTVCPGCT